MIALARRHVCWFSCGAASAVATKLHTARHPDAIVARIDTGSEHPDSERFMDDCAEWFDRPVMVLRSVDYVDTWDVWQRRRFIVSNVGAPCTVELKKKVREAFQRPDDVHVFGYTTEEVERLDRFRDHEPGLSIVAPLIPEGLGKQDCYSIIERAGIELPAMYRLGYTNNNCIGCPKGGIGYWNKIRVDFPARFAQMAALERDIGHAVLSEEIPGTGRQKRPVWLDELDPDRGDYGSEPDGTCSLNCVAVEAEMGAT